MIRRFSVHLPESIERGEILATSADSATPVSRPGNQVATPSSTSSVAPRALIDIQRIQGLANRATSMVEQIRGRLLAPEAKKVSPLYSASQVAALCGVDKAHVNYRISKGDLPVGQLTPTGGKREFSLPEVQRWSRTYRSEKMRPAGQRAICIAVANFKGGVSKTTSAMILAQGLSLRGHRVLAIDMDPQGSLTTLNGLLPEAEVSEDMTVAPLCSGETDDITPAIRSTYWDGLDLVAAAPFLFSAEFSLPARQMSDPTFRFWDVLNAGLEPVRNLYDIIVIDTPPSLSYVTINGLWAADGIVVPVPPSGLDFASSSQFWSLLADLGSNLDRQEGGGLGRCSTSSTCSSAASTRPTPRHLPSGSGSRRLTASSCFPSRFPRPRSRATRLQSSPRSTTSRSTTDPRRPTSGPLMRTIGSWIWSRSRPSRPGGLESPEGKADEDALRAC